MQVPSLPFPNIIGPIHFRGKVHESSDPSVQDWNLFQNLTSNALGYFEQQLSTSHLPELKEYLVPTTCPTLTALLITKTRIISSSKGTGITTHIEQQIHPSESSESSRVHCKFDIWFFLSGSKTSCKLPEITPSLVQVYYQLLPSPDLLGPGALVEFWGLHSLWVMKGRMMMDFRSLILLHHDLSIMPSCLDHDASQFQMCLDALPPLQQIWHALLQVWRKWRGHQLPWRRSVDSGRLVGCV